MNAFMHNFCAVAVSLSLAVASFSVSLSHKALAEEPTDHKVAVETQTDSNLALHKFPQFEHKLVHKRFEHKKV